MCLTCLFVRAVGANDGCGCGARVCGSALVVAGVVTVIVRVIGAGLMVLCTGATSSARLVMMPLAEGRADERLGLHKQHGEQHDVPRHG